MVGYLHGRYISWALSLCVSYSCLRGAWLNLCRRSITNSDLNYLHCVPFDIKQKNNSEPGCDNLVNVVELFLLKPWGDL